MRSNLGSEYDSQGNIQDLTYMQTQRSIMSLSKMKSITSDRSSSKKKRTQEEEEELEKLSKDNLSPSLDDKKAA